jgi:hypothetical protein
MLPIVSNKPGLVVLAVGSVAGVAARLGFGAAGYDDSESTFTGLIAGAVVAAGADIGYRARQTEFGASRYIRPSTGGMVNYAPVWCLAVVFGLVWLVHLIRSTPEN